MAFFFGKMVYPVVLNEGIIWRFAVKIVFCCVREMDIIQWAVICCVSCEIALKTENGLSMSAVPKINRMS